MEGGAEMVLNYMQVIAIILFHIHCTAVGIVIGILMERTRNK